MKTIELTEEHKSKLLEMCNVLFPEYTFITFQNEAIMGAGWSYNFNNICFSNKSNKIFDIEQNIHWFEFCMTWLSHKIIFNPKEKLRLCEYKQSILTRNIMGIFYGEEIAKHPVDYLYDEFEKLK